MSDRNVKGSASSAGPALLLIVIVGCGKPTERRDPPDAGTIQPAVVASAAAVQAVPTSKDADRGLSPAVACALTKADSGMAAGTWKHFGPLIAVNGLEWGCVSKTLAELGPEGSLVQNNAGFYAYGTEDAVKLIRFALNINVPGSAALARKKFASAAAQLTKKVLKAELPDGALDAMKRGRAGEWLIAGSNITFSREDYAPEGIKGGHTWRYEIHVN
jgi:hypothetical protein